MKCCRVWVVLIVFVLVSTLGGTAGAADPVTGTVQALDGAAPIEGATVTLAGPNQTPISASTDGSGAFSIAPPGSGPFSVGVEAPGFGGESVGSVSGGDAVAFHLDTATFTPLPVYAGTASDVQADATTGIFYALVAPEVYRTDDHGGTWRRVTMGYDDPDSGLQNSYGDSAMAVSGLSGEVAVSRHFSREVPGGSAGVSYSRDYGLTWHSVADPPPIPPPAEERTLGVQLFWGHAGPSAPDVLLAARRNPDDSWDVWRADMSAASPAFVKDPDGTFPTGSVIDVADSESGSFIGRVTTVGALRFAPLTAGGTIDFGSVEASGLPAPPDVLALGGVTEPSAPPDGALVVGGAPSEAVMLTKDEGATSFVGGSHSAPTTIPGGCGWSQSRFGTVAPTSAGTSGGGNAGPCWLQKDGTAALTFTGTFSGESGGYAYDAEWGEGAHHVAIGWGSLGPNKTVELDVNGVPVTSTSESADPGTDPGSLGRSVTGITSAPVLDTAYGPAGAQDLAVALQHLTLASKDGGQTMTNVLPPGPLTHSIQWWDGASGEWLVFGGGHNCGDMLTALQDWDGVTTLTEANVDGSSCAELGGPTTGYWGTGGYALTSLSAVPGTDTLFIGASTLGQDIEGSGNHIYRATIVPGSPPSLTGVVDVYPSGVSEYSALAMAYCPPSSADVRMRDVLFVATARYGFSTASTRGSLLRVADATGTPDVTIVDSVPHDAGNTQRFDVRASCDTGTVYTGGSGGIHQADSLFKSTDGGETFALVPVPGVGFQSVGWLSAIGLDPSDPSDVTIASSAEGNLLRSTNGGLDWTMLNNPPATRASQINDIELLPSGGDSAPLARIAGAAAAVEAAILGTSTGAYQSDLSVRQGVVAQTRSGGDWLGLQVTDLASDGQPALAVAGSGRTYAVFRRANGLAYVSGSDGSWSLPRHVPRTRAGDTQPALARDADGRLNLAFRRGTGAGRGIYFMRRSGSWSTPRRLSSLWGDEMPAIATIGTRAHIVFLRPDGAEPGLRYVTNRGGEWGAPRDVPGSRAKDTDPTFGGPSLAARDGVLHLSFARRGPGPPHGIYYTRRGATGGWKDLDQLTSVGADRQPSVVVGSNGVEHIVFVRTGGDGSRGLIALRHNGGWTRAKIPGTRAADRQPSLAIRDGTLRLAFVRTNDAVGIYFDRKHDGHWLDEPRRRTRSAYDQRPVIGVDPFGRVTLLFERR